MALVLTGKVGEAMDPTSEEFMEKGQSGQVVGVIIPPPDIRAVVDKTAQFVARHGKDFEQKIIQKAAAGGGSASKFNFMRQGDPYNAYYEFKIKEFEEGGPVAKPKPAAAAEAPQPDEEKKGDAEEKATDGSSSGGGIVRKQKMNALAAALTSKDALVKPPPHVFSMVHPVGERGSSLPRDTLLNMESHETGL
jgi:splicing factor 3A subunit 1